MRFLRCTFEHFQQQFHCSFVFFLIFQCTKWLSCHVSPSVKVLSKKCINRVCQSFQIHFVFILISKSFRFKMEKQIYFKSKICEIRRTLMWALLLGCWQVPVLFVVLLNFPDQWPSQAQSSLAPCSISWISLFDFQCQFWLRANLHTTHTQDVESP